jgi:hypothetical protein
MHMSREFTGEEMRRFALMKTKIGAGLTEEQLQGAVRMELWETLCNHPCKEDYQLFDLYNADNELLISKRV